MKLHLPMYALGSLILAQAPAFAHNEIQTKLKWSWSTEHFSPRVQPSHGRTYRGAAQRR